MIPIGTTCRCKNGFQVGNGIGCSDRGTASSARAYACPEHNLAQQNAHPAREDIMYAHRKRKAEVAELEGTICHGPGRSVWQAADQYQAPCSRATLQDQGQLQQHPDVQESLKQMQHMQCLLQTFKVALDLSLPAVLLSMQGR